LLVETLLIDEPTSLSKHEVVDRLLDLLATSGHLPLEEVPSIREGIWRREELGPIAILEAGF